MDALEQANLLVINPLSSVDFLLALPLLDSLFIYVLLTFVLLILLMLSGIVSGSEAAFFSLNAQQLIACKKSTLRCDNHALSLLGVPQRLLATLLIVNNFINISFVTIATFMVWRMVGTQTPKGQIITLLTAVVTLLIVFFGEIAPKIYARQHSLRYVRFVATSWYYTALVLTPFTWIFCRIHAVLEKRIQHGRYSYSASSLRAALDLARGDTMQKDMLQGLVSLSSTPVKQIMRSRHGMTVVERTADLNQILDTIRESGFSRIPVCDGSLDTIKGIVYSKDLLPHLNKPSNFNWCELMRTAYFVPDNKKIGVLFKDFQKKRVHMAIVVDEYGGTLGLVTLEDIIEEIIGDIHDESDTTNELQYKKLDHRTYVFEARIPLSDFCKVLNLPDGFFAPIGDTIRSLAGLILELYGKLPHLGTRVAFKNLTFIIDAVDKKRILRVRVLVSALVY